MSEDAINFNVIPAKALNYSSRLLLAKSLNPEQNLLSSDGFARDYRGLAEQMNFSYDDIRNFQRNENPTMKVLESWTTQKNATVGKLIDYLEKMGRHDVVQELQLRFENDSRIHLQEMEKYREIPVQVPEVTSCPTTFFGLSEQSVLLQDHNGGVTSGPIMSGLSKQSILTREDANTGECTLYDAYISYADEDIEFVYYLAKYLEESEFKLFIRSRDLLAGHSEYDTNMQLIKERCRTVLIVLTPDFIKCPACEVQASFAASLGYEERCRKIVPILLKPCEIPLIMRFLHRIDFTIPDVEDWIWGKIKSSLREKSSAVFISSERRSVQGNELLPQLEPSTSPDSAHPCITFPPSSSYPLSISSENACISSVDTVQHETIADGNSTEGKFFFTKQKNKLKNLKSWLTKKTIKKDGYFSSNSISSSNATSGFHSQSGSVLESIGSNDCSRDTSV